MMIRARAGIALCSILLACVIACPRLALAAAPSITGPVFATYLADVTAGTVEITMLELTGENFGTPTLSGPTSVQVAGVTYSSTAPEIRTPGRTAADHRADLPHDHLRQCDGNHGERFGVEGNRPSLCARLVRHADRPARRAVRFAPHCNRFSWSSVDQLRVSRGAQDGGPLAAESCAGPRLAEPSRPRTPQSDPARCGPPFAVDGALCGGVCPAQRAPGPTRAVAAKPSASTARAESGSRSRVLPVARVHGCAESVASHHV